MALVLPVFAGCFGHHRGHHRGHDHRGSSGVEAFGAVLGLVGAGLSIAAEVARERECDKWARAGGKAQPAQDSWRPDEEVPTTVVWLPGVADQDPASEPTALRTEAVTVFVADIPGVSPEAFLERTLSLARARGALAVDDIVVHGLLPVAPGDPPPAGEPGAPILRHRLTRADVGHLSSLNVAISERVVDGTRTITETEATYEYNGRCERSRPVYRTRRESFREVRTLSVATIELREPSEGPIVLLPTAEEGAPPASGAGVALLEVTARLWFLE